MTSLEYFSQHVLHAVFFRVGRVRRDGLLQGHVDPQGLGYGGVQAGDVHDGQREVLVFAWR